METGIEIPVLTLHMPFEFLCSEELPTEILAEMYREHYGEYAFCR